MTTDTLDMVMGVMGLPAINESLESLISHMSNFQGESGLGTIRSYAKIVGLCCAMGVGANECYQMMLGRRGIDVMKLIHIVIISICISCAGTIARLAAYPGEILEAQAQAMAEGQNKAVALQEERIAELQEEYITKVRKQLQQLELNQKAENEMNDDGLLDKIVSSVNELQTMIENRLKEAALLAETKLCEWISLIIRYIGEVIFQVSYYGLLVSKNIFMHILAAFAPLMFAMSLSPHYKSAWSQWLSKYISVSLWGFVTYICLYYVDYIMLFNLAQDEISYSQLIAEVTADQDGNAQVAAIGMQAVGSTCMYVVALLVGARVIAFVPEVASWLIPGGVSSGAGGAAAAAGMGAASMAQGATSAVAGGIGGGITKTIATIAGGSAGGNSGVSGAVKSVVQNSSLGMKYDSARSRTQRGNSPK